MNLSKLIVFQLFVFTIIFNSCNHSTEEGLQAKVEKITNQVQQNFVPDKRDNIFNIETSLSGNKVMLNGETSHPKVQQAFDSLMKANQIEFIDSIQFLPNSSVADKPLAIIRLSVANLRKEASLSAELISQVLMGQIVKLFKKEGSWYLVQTPDRYFGWIHKFGLATKTATEIKEWEQAEKLIVTDTYSHMFFEPTIDPEPVCDILVGNLLKLVTKRGNFYLVELADGKSGFVKENNVENYKAWQSKIDASPENIVKTAMKFLGVPYMWVGTSAKFMDCSGFTQTVYKLNGIQLQRDASQQVNMGYEIDTIMHFAQLQPGDLLFFGRKATETSEEKATHVAIYIGDTEFIHASGLVKINSLDPTRENYSEGRLNTFLHVKRILNSQ